MTCLLDVNVWMALAVVEHSHHTLALAWVQEDSTAELTFCRITQMALLRLLSNPRAMSAGVLSPVSAWRVLDAFAHEDRVRFASEPPGLMNAWRDASQLHHTGVNFWTDTYLAAFAQAAGFTLVTCDRGFKKYPDLNVRLLGAS